MNKVIEKTELVSIAGDLFRQKGYSATSIDDIAKRCRLTKGSLYHHFSGKEELALAALAQVHAYYRDNIFSLVLDRPSPTAEDLARLNQAVEAFFVRHPYGCLLANLEIGGSYEAFKSPIVNFFNEWTLCYQKVYEQYMAKEEAVAHAQDAIAIVQGCVLMNRIQPNLEPLKRQHARLLRQCVAALRA
jgi:AcrR family transcriptional regulator